MSSIAEGIRIPSRTSSLLYCSEQLCHATLPNGVESIVLYKSTWLAKGVVHCVSGVLMPKDQAIYLYSALTFEFDNIETVQSQIRFGSCMASNHQSDNHYAMEVVVCSEVNWCRLRYRVVLAYCIINIGTQGIITLYAPLINGWWMLVSSGKGDLLCAGDRTEKYMTWTYNNFLFPTYSK